jgi:hypothetical protein
MFRRDMRVAIEHAQRLAGGLPADLVTQRPAPSEWSVGECLDHLTITARAYHPIVDAAIARGEPRGVDDYQPSWIWPQFVAVLEPPVKRKFKAVSTFLPTQQRPADEVFRDFVEAHQRLIDALPQLEPLDLGKIRIVSPFASWMRYPLGLVFYIVPAHCRRHLWQADQVVARLPAAGKQRASITRAGKGR